ncbi:DUF6046 domain-containing protein [Mucilaginibacter paludis]|uniref:DUF6046 domain-containing protein n=1 Tax=Mucilaginibacter paludis DSM 18603 TaxID=714943 RepID=H1YAW9_9SPHI|nr:DUF6046 domain-containing protein [Mucilaginibacter paludis]EHQ30002.1 hypothetical protein Mucpa_5942 [Mucilaginibacter paludis DSM 18603]
MSDQIIIPTTQIALGIKSAEFLTRRMIMQKITPFESQQEGFNTGTGKGFDKPLTTRSSLGTPVFVDLTFKEGDYTNEIGSQITFNLLKFDTILISINQSKNIVKTQIQGRSGTIKEYIGMGDYAITINGIIPGTNGRYPLQDVEHLKTILVSPNALTVTSSYLQMFDINSIVVDSFDIKQQEGGYSYQPFTINASSDKPIIANVSSK